MTVDRVELNKLIKNYHKIDGSSTSAISKNLLENKDSVYQLLLPDIKNKVILYIGNSSNNLLTILAKRCEKVIAMYTTDIEIAFIAQKNNLIAPEITNIEYLRYHDEGASKLNLNDVNGVIMENYQDDFLNMRNTLNFSKFEFFLKSFVSKISSNSWIFVKSEGLADRRLFHLEGVNRLFSRIRFLYTFNRLLQSFGYVRNRYYGFDSIVASVFNIVDMDSREQVNQIAFKKRNWLKFFPYRLNRLTLPVVGAYYSKIENDDSVLSKILSNVRDVLTAHSYQITSIEVNDKNKCVLYIELTECAFEKIVLKIGLDEISTMHLLHHFNGLKLLNKNKLDGSELSSYFPTPIFNGNCDGIEFVVESFLPGLPWRYISSPTNKRQLIEKTINVLKSIYSLPVGSLEEAYLSKGGGLFTRINYVIDFIKQKDLLLGEKFNKYIYPILEKEKSGEKRYFYKSDFTVSNIILSDNTDIKIIDLDFWGLSSNRLVDFADFIISYSRCFYNRDLNYCLAAILNSKFEALPSELDIQNSLDTLESDVNTLKNAFILAWLNSIYHVIEFDKSRLNKKHMKKLLYNPIKTILSLCPQ